MDIKNCAYCGKNTYYKGIFCSLICFQSFRSAFQGKKKIRTLKKLELIASGIWGGLTYEAIGRELNIAKQMVSYYAFFIRKQNIPIPMRKGRRGQVAKEGDSWTGDQGYIMEYHQGQWYRQHRLVMERYIGRSLQKNEVVHHINRDKTDNRILNLQLLKRGEHTRITLKEQCNGCKIILDNRRLRKQIDELERNIQANLII